ncbi:DUF4231 domain-containing protein [Streptomyces sp. NPDC058964]|uniref:DUF4231 domain-containing protein n=1 Tax=Streptomyces sp. NPDC058964 TaxID=3346681 RepID=UPI0036965B99
MSCEVVEDIWKQQSVWSQAASHAKISVSRSFTLVLGLGVAAAVLGAFSAQLGSDHPGVARWLAVAAAVGVAVTPLARRGSAGKAVEEWVRMRAMSESCKSDVFLYLAGATPFTGPDRDILLRDRADELLGAAGDLSGHTLRVAPRVRPLPAVTGPESYFTERVDRQIHDYYRPAALRASRRLAWTRRAELFLGLAGAVLAALGAAGLTAATIWVGVVTTVAAAVTAHLASTRLEFLHLEYSRTSGELARLRARANVSGADLPDLIARCEQVISTQNSTWVAKWTAEAAQQETAAS